MEGLVLETGLKTDVGRKREINEDFYGTYSPADSWDRESRGQLFLVADGMGGHAAGETASKLAVETVISSFSTGTGPAEDDLVLSIKEANEAIFEEASRDPTKKGMGTTLVCALVRHGMAILANVGDSRAYLIRNSVATQITRDHSWVGELLAEGKLTPEEAAHHPMRNVVTRSLGSRREVEVAIYDPLNLDPGDCILLCSDGLSGQVDPDTIARVAGTYPPQEAAEILVDVANENGGPDNITVIIFRASSPSLADAPTEQIDIADLDMTQPMPGLY